MNIGSYNLMIFFFYMFLKFIFDDEVVFKKVINIFLLNIRSWWILRKCESSLYEWFTKLFIIKMKRNRMWLVRNVWGRYIFIFN